MCVEIRVLWPPLHRNFTFFICTVLIFPLLFLLRKQGFIRRFWFFWFWIHTASETSTAETHTDGGAVLRKPGSAWPNRTALPQWTPDIWMLIYWILIWRIHSHIVVKKTFAYANIQTNEEENKTQMHHSRLSLNLQTLFVWNMIIMPVWITFIHCFVFNMCITFIRSFWLYYKIFWL